MLSYNTGDNTPEAEIGKNGSNAFARERLNPSMYKVPTEALSIRSFSMLSAFPICPPSAPGARIQGVLG